MLRRDIGITFLSALAVEMLLGKATLAVEAILPGETLVTQQYEWDKPFDPGIWGSPDQRAVAADQDHAHRV